jgi:hypothetical protein
MKFNLKHFGRKSYKLDINSTFEFINPRKILSVYEINGDLEPILFAGMSKKPVRKDELWFETCFEYFVADKFSKNYYEANFSPSGDWNFFTFYDYKTPKLEEEIIEKVETNVLRNNYKFEYLAEITLTKQLFEGEMLINMSTILKYKNNKYSFWAIKHNFPKPDFHCREKFTEFEF